MKEPDYNNSIEVVSDIHWVGFADDEFDLHCNPYLIVEEDEAVLIDPGSIPNFPTVMRKVIDLVNPGSISTIIATHQDPDVCGNLPIVEDIIDRDDLKIAAHTTCLRLIQHYGLSSNLYAVDKNKNKLTLKSGRVLEFLLTPYAHSPGAVVVYDQKTKSMFTSDIFGAAGKNWSLFSGNDFPESMNTWHEAIMPANRILKSVLEKIECFDIARILPQHGSVIEGDQVQVAINHLKNLPCGLDLL